MQGQDRGPVTPRATPTTTQTHKIRTESHQQYVVNIQSQLCNCKASAKVGGVRNVCIKEWVMTSPGSVQKRAEYFRKP